MARIPIMAFFARQAYVLRDQGVTLDGGITLTGLVLHNGASQERIALRTTASGLSGRMRSVRPFQLSPTGGKIGLIATFAATATVTDGRGTRSGSISRNLPVKFTFPPAVRNGEQPLRWTRSRRSRDQICEGLHLTSACVSVAENNRMAPPRTPKATLQIGLAYLIPISAGNPGAPLVSQQMFILAEYKVSLQPMRPASSDAAARGGRASGRR